MEAKQVILVDQKTGDNSKEIFWLRDCWLIIHTREDKKEEWKDTFLLMRSLWKSLLSRIDILSVSITFRLQLYSIQIKIT